MAAESLTQSGMRVALSQKPPATSASTMTPIVFCASCRPWPSAIAAADTVCASRKRRWCLAGAEFRTSHSTPTISTNARPNPTSGERIIGMTTLSRITSQCTVMPAAMPAPVSPPMRACVDDDGRPSHQVMRFHAIAPISPDSTMTSAVLAGDARRCR